MINDKVQRFYSQIVDIKEIKVNERFRKSFKEIDELAKDIKKNGLINPLLVRAIKDKKYNYELVCGERRYRALVAIGSTEVPVNIAEEGLSDLDARILELSENVQRDDLTVAERDALIVRVHELMQQVHGKKKAGRSKKAEEAGEPEGWSVRDTAKKLGVSYGTAQAALTVNEAAKEDPTILDEKDRKEQVKKAQQIKKETQKKQKIAQVVEDKTGEEDKEAKKREFAKTVCGTLVLKKGSLFLEEVKEGYADYIDAGVWQRSVLPEVSFFQRVHSRLKSSGVFTITIPIELVGDCLKLGREAGFVPKETGIWYDEASTRAKSTNEFKQNCVAMCVFVKGMAKIASRSCVFTGSVESKSIYASRPDEVIRQLMYACTQENALCVFLQVESGRALIDCQLTSRIGIGCAPTQDYYDAAVSFINAWIGENV